MAKQYKRKDSFYKKAKEEGFRSRAAYKLIELNQRYKLFRNGSKVLDLGAWPGGWLQVALQQVGKSGLVVGVDLEKLEGFNQENLFLFCCDARDEDFQKKLAEIAPKGFDAVISDMSPKLTGIREVDQAATEASLELAWGIAQSCLASGANFVVKCFPSPQTDLFVRSLKSRFNTVSRTELESSRNSSQESYVLGIGFRKDLQIQK